MRLEPNQQPHPSKNRLEPGPELVEGVRHPVKPCPALYLFPGYLTGAPYIVAIRALSSFEICQFMGIEVPSVVHSGGKLYTVIEDGSNLVNKAFSGLN